MTLKKTGEKLIQFEGYTYLHEQPLSHWQSVSR